MKNLIFIFFLFQLNTVCAQIFKVSFPQTVFKDEFSGRVLLYFSKDKENPKNRLSWPCFSVEVDKLRPNQTILFNDAANFFPLPLSKIERGEYYVQAVFDRNSGGRVIGQSPGNLYSISQKVIIANDTDAIFELSCDQIIPEKTFVESQFVKELRAPSVLLSRFHQKQITIDAPIILPAQYWNEPNRKFPVLFTVAGYGSDYHHYSKSESTDTLPANPIDTIPCIRIYLDGNCSLGHSCYANSANNGPWGDAFVQEFLPALQKKFRCDGAFLMRGHSSGGWSVLWLQTHYPKVFAGCNASAPDPVDFHQFTKTNLYNDATQIEDANALTTGSIKFSSDSVLQEKIRHHNIEDVIYRGEQSTSFNAVFSDKGKDGLPEKIFNFKTGKMNRAVFEHWKQYDINQYLQTNWPKYEPDLKGKIRISVGNEDNAFLNIPVEMLEREMKKMNAAITFAYYPGNHFTVVTAQYKKDELAWLRDKYLEWKKNK